MPPLRADLIFQLSGYWGSKLNWTQWAHAFNILSPVGPNYEGGRLEMETRMTIQMAHRY